MRIEPVGESYEASVEESLDDRPHFVVTGPPRPYEQAVEEALEALRRHLLPEGR